MQKRESYYCQNGLKFCSRKSSYELLTLFLDLSLKLANKKNFYSKFCKLNVCLKDSITRQISRYIDFLRFQEITIRMTFGFIIQLSSGALEHMRTSPKHNLGKSFQSYPHSNSSNSKLMLSYWRAPCKLFLMIKFIS